MLKYIFFFSFFSVLLSCKKYESPSNSKYRIEFGESGGLGNLVKDFAITDNGQAFRYVNGRWNEIENLDKKAIKKIYNSTLTNTKLDWGIVEKNDLQYSIRLITPTERKAIYWGGARTKDVISEETRTVYRNLLNLMINTNE